jgi:pyridoxamine 5'-phosphate oxidase
MDPLRQFDEWLRAAQACGMSEPTAMTLATVGGDGRPSARIVLLKGHDNEGFVFYTNYESRKGRELERNPHAALVFWWPPLARQIRIEGKVEKVSRERSEEYFQTRPLGARLGAWASRQSEVIESRELLERRVEEVARRFPDGEVELPPFWGGYRLRPDCIEFWQSRADRLHDRLRWRLQSDGSWRSERLSP